MKKPADERATKSNVIGIDGRYSARPDDELREIVAEWERELAELADDWSEITASESPQAMLDELERHSKPIKRSGEYVRADIEAALKECKRG